MLLKVGAAGQQVLAWAQNRIWLPGTVERRTREFREAVRSFRGIQKAEDGSTGCVRVNSGSGGKATGLKAVETQPGQGGPRLCLEHPGCTSGCD